MEPTNRHTTRLPDERPILLTAKQVARLLQIGERTLWRHVRAQKFLAPLRVGGATRWQREAVERWVAEGCPTKPRAEAPADRQT